MDQSNQDNPIPPFPAEPDSTHHTSDANTAKLQQALLQEEPILSEPGQDPLQEEPILPNLPASYRRKTYGAPAHARPQHEAKPERMKKAYLRFLIEIGIAVVIALVLTGLLKTFVAQPYQVPTGSMESTIMIGDTIIAEKITYAFNPVQRGDIVVFMDKTQTDRILVKRVIALAGDVVDLRNGSVIVNGVALDEPYTHGRASYPLTSTYLNMTIEFPYTVPAGSIWVMGDNRTHSADSRYFGPILEDSVLGRVIVVIWPPSDMSLL